MRLPLKRASAHALIEQLTVRPESLTPNQWPPPQEAQWCSVASSGLPPDHPMQAVVRPATRRLALRHAFTRRALAPLLRVWHEHGIEVMVIKGFALAEFEYANPGQRFYHDVDLLLPHDPSTLIAAVRLAVKQGWHSDGLHEMSAYWNHEFAHLTSPDATLRLDLHRFLNGTFAGATTETLQRLTDGVWRRALIRDVHGVRVRHAHPSDAAVAVLALGRCWSRDEGVLKPENYTDLRLLQRAHRLSDDALLRHATDLGVDATWTAFTACCRPSAEQLRLAPEVTRAAVQAGLRRQGLKGLSPPWRKKVRRGLTILGKLPTFVVVVPDLIAASLFRRRAVQGAASHDVGRALPTSKSESDRLLRLMWALKWWSRVLVWTGGHQRALFRAHLTYHALRRRGYDVRLVAGVSRKGPAVSRHAWIERADGPLYGYGEPLNRLLYDVTSISPDEVLSSERA